MKKAVFLDRDGVVIKMHYNTEHGMVDSVLSPQHVELVTGITDFIRKAQKHGYIICLVSNQPGVALQKMSMDTFTAIQARMNSLLKQHNITLDGEFYCFHHPFATLPKYRKVCSCRKPKPGLIQDAAKEFDIDITNSWMIGDGVNDIVAGKHAGCKTILITNVNESAYLQEFEKRLEGIEPDYFVKNIAEAQKILPLP